MPCEQSVTVVSSITQTIVQPSVQGVTVTEASVESVDVESADTQVIVVTEELTLQTVEESTRVIEIFEGSPGPPGPGATFTDANPTPVTIGGIAAGSTFPTATDMQTMWQRLLYPYLAPAFTSFGISGVASPLEVGQSFGPSVTFDWSTSNAGNVTVNSIAITDVTNASVLASGQANSGSQTASTGSAVARTTAGSHQFGISGENTESSAFSASLTLQWEWRLYFGTNTNASLTSVQLLALSGSHLATGYGGTFAFGSGGYKYICFADAAGGQINSVKDQATGFNVPMSPGSHTDGGGFGYELVSVTNAFGVSTNIRVYKTLNILGGAIMLVVT